ncbi:MAG: hypothetical protein NTW87_01750 [Planctomycetota bacterium]|nr:hypothetical protein [Planctomycetota bacterium]
MKANEPWKEYPTTTVASLGGFGARTAPAPLSQYGGDSSHKGEAKGFFYTKRTGGRWCLVDPDGCLFIHVAACSVTPSRGSKGAEEAFDTKFGSEDKWAQATAELLRANGFNGTGAWSADGLLRKTARPLVYTPIWNFMSAYGKQRGGTFQKPGHTGYPNDAIFVFDPGFETFAMKHAEKLAAIKDDPWLLGHFSDNELPFYRKTLDGFLALKPDDHGYKAARAWLDGHKGKDATAKDIGNAEREAFLGFVIDRYFAIVSKAIKTHDPNHLFLGSRFHSDEKKIEAAFQAAGKYCDVVSVNLYHAWTPDSEQLANWERWSGKPFMITEFYAKGEDSGMANTTGAGWLVKTQRDRGLFYQNFTLGLLRSGGCVGWHHFKYQDNDPENLKTDPSNRDSNKGIVTSRFEEYPPFLKLMRELNLNVYDLMTFDDEHARHGR